MDGILPNLLPGTGPARRLLPGGRLLVAVVAAAGTLFAQAADPVRTRFQEAEASFARALTGKDVPGFARFLAEDAVFLNPGGDLLRGSTTIAETWIRRVVNTEGFHVAGGTAEINPTGTLALVTHPVKDASGQNLPPFQVAWRHDALSGWRVVFGWSCPPCDCAVPRTPPAPPGDEVWGAESSFAQSMADRDHSAFQRHLAEDALFFGPNGPLRGRAAVAAGWSRFFQGPAAPFAWHPERSILLKSGSLALTYGPVWAPDGRRTATFSSVWRKDPDGKWRVALDKSCRACDCGGK